MDVDEHAAKSENETRLPRIPGGAPGAHSKRRYRRREPGVQSHSSDWKGMLKVDGCAGCAGWQSKGPGCDAKDGKEEIAGDQHGRLDGRSMGGRNARWTLQAGDMARYLSEAADMVGRRLCAMWTNGRAADNSTRGVRRSRADLEGTRGGHGHSRRARWLGDFDRDLLWMGIWRADVGTRLGRAHVVSAARQTYRDDGQRPTRGRTILAGCEAARRF